MLSTPRHKKDIKGLISIWLHLFHKHPFRSRSVVLESLWFANKPRLGQEEEISHPDHCAKNFNYISESPFPASAKAPISGTSNADSLLGFSEGTGTSQVLVASNDASSHNKTHGSQSDSGASKFGALKSQKLSKVTLWFNICKVALKVQKPHKFPPPRYFGHPSQLQLQGHWNILTELEKWCEIQASWPFILGNLRVPSTPQLPSTTGFSYGLIFQTYEKISVPQQSPKALFPVGGCIGGVPLNSHEDSVLGDFTVDHVKLHGSRDTIPSVWRNIANRFFLKQNGTITNT